MTGFPAPATDLSLGYGFPETDPVASTGKFDRDSTSKEVSSTFSDAFSWGPVMDLPWRIPASISRVRFMGLVDLGRPPAVPADGGWVPRHGGGASACGNRDRAGAEVTGSGNHFRF